MFMPFMSNTAQAVHNNLHSNQTDPFHFQALSSLLMLLLVHGGGGQRRPRRQRPSRQQPGAGLNRILQGVELNILDSKFLGLGYVREDLVEELCTRATLQLVREGEQRAQRELSGGGLVAGFTNQVTDKCSQLVGEGEKACQGVLDMVSTRFDSLKDDTVKEAETQCENAKELTLGMVKKGAEAAFKSSAELGTQLARTEFLRQVEVEKNRGERMFQEEVEKNRGLAEAELRRRVREGKELGEKEFLEQVRAGKEEGERQYQQTILEERAKAEKILKDTVEAGRAEAEVIFAREVAKGREEAERLYAERALEGREKGEKICSEMINVACQVHIFYLVNIWCIFMINVACQNATEGTDSFDFCEEFFFFTDDLGEDRRRKRQNDRLYGSFYNKFH